MVKLGEPHAATITRAGQSNAVRTHCRICSKKQWNDAGSKVSANVGITCWHRQIRLPLDFTFSIILTPSTFCCLWTLHSDEDPSVCEKGAQVAECPREATCRLGRILSCELPFNLAADGQGCVMSRELEEEVHAVVEVLR